jgi:hypothetical protein
MKKILLLLSLSAALNTYAQMVTETVDFDYYTSATDNDLENRFDGGLGLTQIQTNGITGGCLETPTTINWGTDNATYCTRFKGVIGETYEAGISFKYDTSNFNNINFDRPVSLWMKPYVDPNHYIIASVLDSKKIQIVSYSATGSSLTMQLQQGHWYELFVNTAFNGGGTGDEIIINAQVNDLGTSGTNLPIPAGYANTTLHDSIIIADTSIEVSITGTSWGGAQYLDNFRIEANKSYDNCITTAVEEYTSDDIQIANSGLAITVSTGNLQQGSIDIYDVHGKKLVEMMLTSGKTIFDTSGMPAGIYFVTINSGSTLITKKFVLNQ